MKNTSTPAGPTVAPSAAMAVLFALLASACDQNIPVDRKCAPDEPSSKDCNPGVFGPQGIIRGTVSYIGPAPCVRNGLIEGAAVVLLFDAANPPPPDGLATTALNFATVPGETLFASYPRPKTGPGSPGNPEALCPPLDAGPVTAGATYALSQLPAGRYQVRGFYSRQNRFQPVFDFANLPLAGDTGGGVLVDPRASVPKFATITIGRPNGTGGLTVPDGGFLVDGVPLILGQVLTTGRPYFSIDLAGSHGFTNVKAPVKGETAVPYPNDDPTKPGDSITIPQDHPLTAEPNFIDATDLFKTVQASFPAVHFKYGFPGDPSKFDSPDGFDAWLAKNAFPADPFFADKVRPFYGIDPTFSPLTSTGPLKEATTFTLSRAFLPSGSPIILHDNPNIETFKFAQLFPIVVLAKLKDGPDGYPLDPPTPQTDPVVVLQGITLRGNSMTLTSAVDGKGLASDTVRPSDEELSNDFTSVIRTASLCLDPTKTPLKGSLAAPYFFDFNPKNTGDKVLVDPPLVTKYQELVGNVVIGCLPPGYYSVNVVYATGQAWSLPNQTGYCTYDSKGRPAEDCFVPAAITAAMAKNGFTGPRPLLVSQQAYRDKDKKIPQIVLVTPTERCMTKNDSDPKFPGKVVWTNHTTHEDKNGNGVRDADEPDVDADGILGLRVHDACIPKANAGKPFTFVQPK